MDHMLNSAGPSDGITVFVDRPGVIKIADTLLGIGMSEVDMRLRLRDIDAVMRVTGMSLEAADKFNWDTTPGWTTAPLLQVYESCRRANFKHRL